MVGDIEEEEETLYIVFTFLTGQLVLLWTGKRVEWGNVVNTVWQILH